MKCFNSIRWLPSPIAQMEEQSTWLFMVVGSMPGLANLTITSCLLGETLSHYQTTNFRIFQTEIVCRQQFRI